MDVERLDSEMIDMKNSVNQMDEVRHVTNLLGRRLQSGKIICCGRTKWICEMLRYRPEWRKSRWMESSSSPDEHQAKEEKLSKKGRGRLWKNLSMKFNRLQMVHDGTVSIHVGEVGDYWLLRRCASVVMLVVARCASNHEWVINAREKELMKPKSLETAEAVELKAKMNVVVKQSMSSPISQQFQLSTAKLIVVLTLVKKQLLAYEDVVERNLGFEVEKKGAFISKLEDTFTAILTFLDTVYELLNGMCLLKCTTMSYKADNRMLFLCGTNKNEESFIVEWNESGGDAKRTYQGLCKNPSAIV
ncbi:hypothetical protein V6N13_103442 [Hibiscus sabdariffa]